MYKLPHTYLSKQTAREQNTTHCSKTGLRMGRWLTSGIWRKCLEYFRMNLSFQWHVSAHLNTLHPNTKKQNKTTTAKRKRFYWENETSNQMEHYFVPVLDMIDLIDRIDMMVFVTISPTFLAPSPSSSGLLKAGPESMLGAMQMARLKAFIWLSWEWRWTRWSTASTCFSSSKFPLGKRPTNLSYWAEGKTHY